MAKVHKTISIRNPWAGKAAGRALGFWSFSGPRADSFTQGRVTGMYHFIKTRRHKGKGCVSQNPINYSTDLICKHPAPSNGQSPSPAIWRRLPILYKKCLLLSYYSVSIYNPGYLPYIILLLGKTEFLLLSTPKKYYEDIQLFYFLYWGTRIKPRILYMKSKHLTTELYPQP